VVSNSVLEEVLYQSMTSVPLPVYTEQELNFAKEIKKTVKEIDMASDLSLTASSAAEKRKMIAKCQELPMMNFVLPHKHLDINIPGSSDVGDCSHVVPTAQFIGACFVPGTPAHSWQAVAQGISGTAVKGMLYAARVLSDTAKRLINDPTILSKAKEEFLSETGGKPYHCPIPPEIMPNSNAKK
jgi:aminobenzoyl-glutamate utilization protein B